MLRAQIGIPGLHLSSVTDPTDNERERSICEKTSNAFDPDRLGIGSSPIKRDFASSGVMVPQIALNVPGLPISNPVQRHMIRLAAQYVSSNDVCRIVGLRTGATLRQKIAYPGGEEATTSTYVMEQEIVSPFWTPPDGNISWHLRTIRATPNSQGVYEPVGAPVYALSNDLTGTGPALLYSAVGGVIAGVQTFLPPGLPGEGIGDLGTFYDNRFPWSAQGLGRGLDYVVYGPCIIALFASVKQTDPETRTVYVPPDSGFCGPMEEQFAQSFDMYQYGHVYGSIVCEMGATQRRPGIRQYVGKTPH